MSVGTFADRASRAHIKNIARQKKVVFGERPTEISATVFKFHGDDNNEIELSRGNPLNLSDNNLLPG